MMLNSLPLSFYSSKGILLPWPKESISTIKIIQRPTMDVFFSNFTNDMIRTLMIHFVRGCIRIRSVAFMHPITRFQFSTPAIVYIWVECAIDPTHFLDQVSRISCIFSESEMEAIHSNSNIEYTVVESVYILHVHEIYLESGFIIVFAF